MDTLLLPQEIAVNQITANNQQIRKIFDKNEMQTLCETIKIHGLLQPILVKKIKNGYEIVAGERRWRAAKKIGLNKIPCIIKNYTQAQALAVMAVENSCRSQLSAIEEAEAVANLINKHNYTHEEVGAALGYARTKVTNYMRLLKLDNAVKDMMLKKELSEGHGKVLAGLDIQLQLEFALEAIRRKFSVRQLERHIKRQTDITPVRKSKKSEDISANQIKNLSNYDKTVQQNLSSFLQTCVVLCKNFKCEGGQIMINYNDNKQLEKIISKIYGIALTHGKPV